MTFKKFMMGVAVVAGALTLPNAQATVVDFSGAAEGGSYTSTAQSSNGPQYYTAQGFTFNSVGDEAHLHENYFGAGTVLLHDNTAYSPDAWVLTRVGGGTFDVTSFSAIVSSGLHWFTDLNLVGGNALNGLNVVNLSGISSLSFVLTNPGACCGEGMNQFVLSASSASTVPEPASLVLLGMGLFGIGFSRRKQA